MKNKLNILKALWLVSPIFIWLAYQPLIRLGEDGTMHYELSVTVIFALILAIFSIPSVWRQRKLLIKMHSVWLVSFIQMAVIVSLLWTPNFTRGILTVGITGIIYLIFLGAMAELRLMKSLIPKIIKIYLLSSVVVCFIAIIQFFAGLWLSSSVTFLCAGCSADQFGFVRPNVFLIEPQFLGSALLPAALIITNRLLKSGMNWRLGISLSIVILTLVLTLSRGALIALFVGLVILAVIYIRNVKRILLAAGIAMVSAVSALSLQGLAVSLNPSIDKTFIDGVSASINQLTMGIINISPEKSEPKSNQPVPKKEPHFDGYVEESTNARTTRTSLALQTWSKDWQTIIFGAGIGSAGVAIHEKFPDEISAREIVQNEYAEILLERGIIGFLAFVAVFIGLFIGSRRQKWLWAIIAAFMVQWIFFSGYPNAMHIYLTLILITTAAIERPDQSKPAKPYSSRF